VNLPLYSGLDLPAPLALSVVLACIAVAIYAVRALARRRRRHERRQGRAFGQLLQQFLDDKLSARDANAARRRGATATDPAPSVQIDFVSAGRWVVTRTQSSA
jgi:hypothetical protein